MIEKYVWATWKNTPPAWYMQVKGNLFKGEDRHVYVSQLNILQTFFAESLADAKIKFEVGANMFSFVSQNKPLGNQETVGSVNATRRTVDMILRQLSDESVRFLLTTAGIQPSISAEDRIKQLCSRVLH